jgi:DNA-binding transcriptional MerR regulator
MKNKLLYSIGEVARIKKISVKTLRYYHKIGLLIPDEINSDSGYRYYSPHQLMVLDIIIISKRTNASLESIKKIVKSFSLSNVIRFVEERHKELDEKQKDIIVMKKLLNTIYDALKFSEKSYMQSGIQIKTYEERYAVLTPLNDIDIDSDILAHTQLLKYIDDLGIQSSYVTGTLLESSLNDSRLIPKAVFHLIKKSDFKDNHPNFIVLQAGKYLTATYHSNDMKNAQKNIMSFIQDNNHDIQMIIEIDLMDDLLNNTSYSSNIQVLISE